MKKIFFVSLLFSATVTLAPAQNLMLLTKTEKLQFVEQGKENIYYRILFGSTLRIKVNGPAELGIVIRTISNSQLNIPPASGFVVTFETGKSSVYKIQPKEVELENFIERADLYPTNPVYLKLKIPQGSHEYTFSTTRENELGFAIRFIYKPQNITQKPVVKTEPQKLAMEKEAVKQPRKEEKFDRFRPSVNLSTGVNFERYAGRSGQFFKLTGVMEYYFTPLLSLNASIGGDFYKQNYFNYDVNNSVLTVDDYPENRLLSALFLSIHPDLDHKRIDLSPKIGVNGAFVFSKDNSFNILGPSAGAGLEVVFGKASFQINGDYTYNLLRRKPDNILLVAPDGAINYNGIFSIPLNKQIRLRTGYTGESIIFPQITMVNQGNPGELKRVTRFYHGWLIGAEF